MRCSATLGSVDAVWHLGDVVGYGPDPDGVVARLTEIGAVGVRGNHDAAAAGGDEIDWFNPDARAAMEWTRTRISPATRDWLAALPERHTESVFGLVHGSPREPLWEYIVSVPVARANLALLTTPIGLFGHTHLPMVFVEEDGAVEQVEPGNGSAFALNGRRALINPGSVGQPRDGIPTAVPHGHRHRRRALHLVPDRLRRRGRPGRDARRRPPGPPRPTAVVRPVTGR